MGAWFKKELLAVVRELLSPEVVRRRGLFDTTAVASLLRRRRVRSTAFFTAARSFSKISPLSAPQREAYLKIVTRNAAIDGKQAEDLLHEIQITVNRNAVPNDPRPPMVTSGLRIGTPALATRGFGDAEFAEVADIIALALLPNPDIDALRARVATLTEAFPLYPGLSQ